MDYKQDKNHKNWIKYICIFIVVSIVSIISIILSLTSMTGNKHHNNITAAKVSPFGVFTCSVSNLKSTYCPGDEILFKLSTDQTAIYDLSLLFNCQVRGAPTAFVNASLTRPSGPRGFIDNCNPILQNQNFTQFITQGGTTNYIVPGTTNYIGFAQQINIYFFNNDTVGTSSNFLHNAVCPSFQVVSDCNIKNTATATSTDSSVLTSTKISSTAESAVSSTINTGIVYSTYISNSESKTTLFSSSIFIFLYINLSSYNYISRIRISLDVLFEYFQCNFINNISFKHFLYPKTYKYFISVLT